MHSRAFFSPLPGLLILVLLAVLQPAGAQTVWTNPGVGDWFTAGNWNNGVPTSATQATVSNGGTSQIATAAAAQALRVVLGETSGAGTLRITNGSLTTGQDVMLGANAGGGLGSLLVSGGASTLNANVLYAGGAGEGEVTIESGGKITVVSAALGNSAGSDGTAIITGTGSSLTNTGVFYSGFSGSGTLTIENGATMSSAGGSIGTNSGSQGEVTVTGTNSSWTNTGILYVAYQGNGGTLRIENGGSVSNTQAFVASDFGTTGEVTVTGNNSTWINSADLTVGYSGNGSLTIEDEGEVSNTNGFIGSTGGIGNVTVSTMGSWTNSGTLAVGYGGNATLTIEQAGQVSNSTGFIGAAAGGSGEVTVSGVGSTWTNSSDLAIGYLSGATLNIDSSGQVSSAIGYIGFGPTTTGEVTINGSGSIWTATALHLGYEGMGTLNVENGGDLSNTEGSIGRLAGSMGQATITGAGSTWINSGILYVGYQGDGILQIGNGGTVSNTNGFVGGDAGSYGEVTITGAGSSWTSSGTLAVGYAGEGHMTIQNGGLVNNTTGFIGGTGAGVGEVTVTGAGSSWVNSVDLAVGYEANGSLSIQAGGQVSNVTGYVGTIAGVTGTVTVTGAGSAWNTTALIMGNLGNGSLTISDAGTVNVGSMSGVTLGSGAGSSGTIDIGGGGAAGILNSTRVFGGAGTAILNFNHTGSNYFWTNTGTSAGTAVAIEGSIAVNHTGTGLTTLTGAHTYTGATNVTAGELRLAAGASLTNTAVSVANGATFSGSGTMTGSVTIANGGILNPGVGVGTLTLGSLTLNDSSILNYQLDTPGVVGGGVNDLIVVNGALTLNGRLNISDMGNFGSGTYRLFNYTGALTDSGLLFGTIPAGYNLAVDATPANQINLNVTTTTLQYWDGTQLSANGVVDGGNGTWSNSAANTNWTSATGNANSPWGNLTAIFSGAAGTVTIANGEFVQAQGLHFITNNYLIQAGATGGLTLLGTGDVEVDAGMTATIDAPISGTAGLGKTGAGTLVVTGANTFVGDIDLTAGTLMVDDSTTFDPSSSLNVADGTTFGVVDGDFATISNDLVLAGNATFSARSGGQLEFDGDIPLGTLSHTITLLDDSYVCMMGEISGSGGLYITASNSSFAPVLEMCGLSNTYTGLTRVGSDATLYLTKDPNEVAINGDIQIDVGGLLINEDYDVTTTQIASTSNVQVDGELLFQGLAADFNQTLAGLSGSGFVTNDLLLDAYALELRVSAGNFAGTIRESAGAGSISLVKETTGTLVLSGSNTYTGSTTVEAGTLNITGALANTSGVTVASGAALSGTGTIAGPVTIADSGEITPATDGTAGTFTLGALTLNDTSVLNYDLDAPGGTNDRIMVNGALTLDGILNVNDLGAFGDGTYRLFDYTAALTDEGLVFGSAPAGFDLEVNTATSNQVNLIVTSSTSQYWDGSNTTPNNVVDGGSGTWSNDMLNTNWTNLQGNANNSWDDLVAVFTGTAGTVTLANGDTVRFQGMRFLTSGYSIDAAVGAELTPDGIADITLATGVSATINASVTGQGGLRKVGAGTLTLTGSNTYSGGTELDAGILRVSTDANLGDASGTLTFDGGTLQATGSFLSTRSAVLDPGDGTFDIDPGHFLAWAGDISGAGTLIKEGVGTLTLQGTNSYAGGTEVGSGNLVAGSNNAFGTGPVAIDGDNTVVEILSGVTVSNTFETINGGTVLNRGTIDSGAAPSILNFVNGSTVENRGTIRSDTLTIGANDGVFVLNNASTDSLVESTADDALHALTDPVSVRNDGTIRAAGTALVLDQGGDIVNNGSIQGGTNALVAADGQTVLENHGQIIGGVLLSDKANQVTLGGNSSLNGALDLGGNVGSRLILTGAATTRLSQAVTGQITSSGAALKQGSGTWIIDKVLPSPAGLTIQNGKLSLVDGGSLQGEISNDGELSVERTTDYTFGNRISGSGRLVQDGTSNTLLLAENTYTGGTEIRQGSITIGGDGTLPGDVLNDGELYFRRSEDYVFNGIISGRGDVIQDGSSNTILVGEQTYSGTTYVRRGGLILGDGKTESSLAGDVVIDEGAYFGGAGTIGGDMALSGTLSPGYSPGSLTVKGNFTLESTALLVVEIASARDYDKLTIGGKAKLGGTIRIVVLGKYQPVEGAEFDVIQAKSLTGRFDTVNQPGNWTLDYSGNQLVLIFHASIARKPYQFYAETPNQFNAAVALETLREQGSNSDFDRNIRPILDALAPNELRQAFEAVMPNQSIAFSSTALARSKSWLPQMATRLADIRAGSRGFVSRGFNERGASDMKDVLAPVAQNKWGVWIDGAGVFSEVAGFDGLRTGDASTAAATVGVDYRLSDNFTAGFYTGYVGSWTDFGGNSEVDSNGTRFGIYSTYQNGGFYLNNLVGGEWNSYDWSRGINFPGLSRTATADTEGTLFETMFGGGYDWTIKENLTVGLFSSLEYTLLFIDGFTEQGAGSLNLKVKDQDADSLRTNLGLQTAYSLPVGQRTLRPSARIAWRHEYLDGNRRINSALAGGAGPGFSTLLPGGSRKDSLLLNAGFSMDLTDNVSGYVYYTGDLAGGTDQNIHSVNTGIRVSF